jgi:zinc D-Ala-D-Ala carboxypeptidase
MTPLSPHFDLEEFLRSETAVRMGRPVQADAEIRMQLRRLCALVLEPLHLHCQRPVRVLSGYRPPWLNALVGGSKTSEHMEGRAADIAVDRMSPIELASYISGLDLPFNQLILEFDEWVHVSVPDVNDPPKREVLTARRINGKTIYSAGIVPKAAA